MAYLQRDPLFVAAQNAFIALREAGNKLEEAYGTEAAAEVLGYVDNVDAALRWFEDEVSR